MAIEFECGGEAISFRVAGSSAPAGGTGGGAVGAGGEYRFRGVPKPCLHPLTTARGVTVTGFQPGDHPWHRGLWFTIKYINGTNFWEENAPQHGVQRSEAAPDARLLSSGRLELKHTLVWWSGSAGEVVREHRTIEIAAEEIGDGGMGGAGGGMTIDWRSELVALRDLVLDRTPFTTWGGYSGFSYRGPALHGAQVHFPDGASEQVVVARRAPWILLKGRIGEQPGSGGGGKEISVGLINHPSNPSTSGSPVPWYGQSVPEYVFLNAAFLFDGPMRVARDQRLVFRCRCVLGDGSWGMEEMAARAASFLASA